MQTIHSIFKKTEPFDPIFFGWDSFSSTNKWPDFKIFDSTKKCLNSLKSDGFTIFATYLGKESANLYETDFSIEKIAPLIGSEKLGLSKSA